MKLKTFQRILNKFSEPLDNNFKPIQDIYRLNKYPDALPNAKEKIKELESKGLNKSAAICKYYSKDILNTSELYEIGLNLKALDKDDIKTCLPWLTENKENKHCSYLIGSILSSRNRNKALKYLEYAADEIDRARDSYCTLLLQNKEKQKVFDFLTLIKTHNRTDYYHLSLVDPCKDKSLIHLVKSAELGLKEAQFNLGVYYLEGKLNGGIPQAQCWFYLAAYQGHKLASHNLEQFMTKSGQPSKHANS